MKAYITKSDLSLQIKEKEYHCGTFLHNNGGKGLELWKIKSQVSEGRFVIVQVNACTLEETDYSCQISLSDLKQYYRPVNMDMNRIHNLSLRLLDGEVIEDGLSQETDDAGTELMHLGDKAVLMVLCDELSNVGSVAEMVRTHAQCIADEMHREIEKKIEKMNGVLVGIRRQVDRLEYVIQTIETYAGIKENVRTLRQGVPADASFPVVVRQAVVYLDEEMALLDHEFDWQKIPSFDEWLVKDDNYKKLMPDIKSIVAVKPRRKDMVYASGNTVEERYHNWVMNEPNHQTMFLIRNGDNLYRLDSEHIALEDRMFPNANEFQQILQKEAEEEKRWGKSHTDEYSDGMRFRKRFTRVSFLLQGLFDRSEVFAPHAFKGSLIKMQGLDGHVEMYYELDFERQLSDGRMMFREWYQKLNEGLTEGNRIMLVAAGRNYYGYEYRREDYVTYYSNDWNIPGYPADGIYTLYKSQPTGSSIQNRRYFERHPFIVKFKSEVSVYSWTGVSERKNRVSIHIDPRGWGVLNYDALNIEDIDYYLNSRLHRSQYYQFVVMLQKVKELLLQEQRNEDDFIRMMVGQILGRGYNVKQEYTPEQVVRIALDTIKARLKWKRPVSSKEKETFTLVERTLFSKGFMKKYFK